MVVTLRDIAARANVSHATVSVVLNNRKYPVISDHTREKVMRVARDLGYQPNPLAQALATGRSKMISIWSPLTYTPAHLHFSLALHLLIRSHGYKMLWSGNPLVSEQGDFSQAFTWPVDGIVAVDCPHYVSECLNSTTHTVPPLVSVGSLVSSATDHCCVDMSLAAQMAIAALREQGRSHITLLTASLYNTSTDRVASAYIDCMTQSGLAVDVLCVSDSSRASAYAAVRTYMQEKPQVDALLAYNSLLAVGAVAALRDLSISIPKQVALISADSSDELAFQSPPISCIDFPIGAVANAGWDLLLKRIEDPTRELQKVVFEPHITLRASSLG